VQGRDGHTSLEALQSSVDQRERLVAPHEMGRHPDGDVGDRHRASGRLDAARGVEGAQESGASNRVPQVVAEKRFEDAS
jgi:hypothetical protein